MGWFQRRRRVRRRWRRWEGQFDLLIAACRRGGGGLGERGGVGQKGCRSVHISDEVDKFPLVVDAFLLRDSLLLFSLLVEVGEDEGASCATTDGHQNQDADQGDVEGDCPVFGV